MNNKIAIITSYIIFTGIIMLTGFLCLSVQGNAAVNGNISWLLIGAQRLLQGQNMLEHIYEPNPPLSLLIYIPHALFSQITNLPLPISSFYTTGIITIISITTVKLIIKRYPFLNKAQQLGFTACYAIAATLTTSIFFSEREHIMFLAIAPFMLAQFALMEKIYLPKILSITVFMVGALGFLIKPHYGLVPTIFLFTRLIKYKNPANILKSPDFLALSSMTLLYAAIIFISFKDYTQIIFPDLIDYYIGRAADLHSLIHASTRLTLLYLIIFVIEFFQSTDKKPNPAHKLTLFLYLSALLFLTPYYIQMKGYFNHLIPANSFFMMGICASIITRIYPFTSEKLKWSKNLSSSITLLASYICVASLSQALIPLNNYFPTNNEIKNMPVARFLKKHCKEPCPFFSFHTDMEIMPTTAVITGYEHASRFGSLWFMPGLLEDLQSQNTQTRQEAIKTKQRISQYILEDLKYYNPKILLIAKDISVSQQNTSINFMNFFGQHKPLRDYIKTHYKKDEIFEFDRKPYFKGTTLGFSHILRYDTYTILHSKREQASEASCTECNKLPEYSETEGQRTHAKKANWYYFYK